MWTMYMYIFSQSPCGVSDYFGTFLSFGKVNEEPYEWLTPLICAFHKSLNQFDAL